MGGERSRVARQRLDARDRGGPKGFVKVLDPHTIGFADCRGNKQYISLGNVGGDDRVALIFVERAFVLAVEGFDWNCPQHITPRFTEDEVRESVAPLIAKLETAEAENRKLRASLAKLGAAGS